MADRFNRWQRVQTPHNRSKFGHFRQELPEKQLKALRQRRSDRLGAPTGTLKLLRLGAFCASIFAAPKQSITMLTL